MSAGHGSLEGALYRRGSSAVHRLPAHCKLVAAMCFVFVVVATPRQQFWAFGAYLALLAVVAAAARVPPWFIAPRMLVELPFVLFALALPFLSTGTETVQVLGLQLSESGLLGAFNILAKGTLGVITALLLSATTQIRDLLRGLEQLRVPRIFVLIASFMVRYLTVVTAELHRMWVSMASRGFQAGSARQWKAVASTAGALFIRTYERGERVYLAMLSRGYTGQLPGTPGSHPGPSQWTASAALPAAALVVAVTAWTMQGLPWSAA